MRTIDARKAGTICTRCGSDRDPFRDWTEPYTCQRCTEVLRGSKYVVDPLRILSPEVRTASVARGKVLGARRRHGIATEPRPDPQGKGGRHDPAQGPALHTPERARDLARAARRFDYEEIVIPSASRIASRTLLNALYEAFLDVPERKAEKAKLEHHELAPKLEAAVVPVEPAPKPERADKPKEKRPAVKVRKAKAGPVVTNNGAQAERWAMDVVEPPSETTGRRS